MDLFRNQSLLKSNRFETALWAAKLALMLMGILSTLILFKVSIIPFAFEFVLSTFPRLWVSARSWLSPPVIYIIVNFIIITIAASSNFHHKKAPFSDSPTAVPTTAAEHPVLRTNITTTLQSESEKGSNDPKEEENKEFKHEEQEEAEVKDSGFPCNNSIADTTPEKCIKEYVPPEKIINDYISPDSGDTLEATWRGIIERQGKTMSHQLKESDTWTARLKKAEPFHGNEDGEDDPVNWAKKELRKSDTFNDSASRRREKSMSPEELNRRADAFIQMFNMQMKLQRLESYQRRKEMVNHGVSCD